MKTFQIVEAEEKKAASIARSALKASYINQIKRTFHKRTGKLEKSTVVTRFREGRLDRLAIRSPRYSFQNHFGSTKTGTQKASVRKGANVKSFVRHLKGNSVDVQAHKRSGGSVVAFNKSRSYKVHNHISRALKETNALERLATDLGKNRMVVITSQIDF